ncbi:CBS domain-containing protein [Alteromonadaceae bacterium Bs31]|nr:CBS domain-containing protein [Alteromonadaceae bacterium Bs31]
MVSEVSDVQEFLSKQALFQHLNAEALATASSQSYTSFSRSGALINLREDAGLLVLRSGSVEIRKRNGELLDRLSEGDFLLPKVLLQHALQAMALEDCLYYELAATAYNALYTSDKDFSLLCQSYTRRFGEVSMEVQNPAISPAISSGELLLQKRVADFMSSPPVCASPHITILEAAKIMMAKNVSSLLITQDEDLVGIVTDRDLRTRVLAAGLPDSMSVSAVMTPEPSAIDKSELLHRAQIKMMSAGIHHLPVVDGKQVAGLIGLSDIVRANNIEPVSLIGSVRHANNVAALVDISRQFPALVARLIERDTRSTEVGEIITSLTDGLTNRLIQLAQQELGDAPCEFAWLAFGSQARQEQVIGSDQDNALILSEACEPQNADYFKKLAEFVNEGLGDCGVLLCPGDIMARNDKWRLSLRHWFECFNQWIQAGSPKDLMHASIFFDMRHIYGEKKLSAALQNHVLESAKKNTIFLAHMSDNALIHSPPLGFFKTFVLEKDGDHIHSLDLKKRGTIPIVDIARNCSLSAGISAVSTVDRLKQVADAGVMSHGLVNSLLDAHEFIAGLRLDAQGRQYRAGEAVDNYLDPKTLSPLMRHQLKDAFHLVRQAQAAMKARFGGGLI